MSEKQTKRARKKLWPIIVRLVELGDRPMPTRGQFKQMVRAVVRRRRIVS